MTTKLISPEPNGGMPFKINDLLYIQDGIYEAVSGLAASAQMPIIVAGCNATTTGSNTCTVTDGVVFLDGEFRYFPAYTGNFPFYIVKDTDVFDTRAFQNGAIQNKYVTHKAKAASSAPSNSPSIPMNPGNTANRYKAAMTSVVTANLANEIQDRLDAIQDLQTQINDIVNVQLPSKAAKKFTAIPWTDIVLDTHFESTPAPDYGIYKAQYMMDELGRVQLRGGANIKPSSTGFQATKFADLPASITPAYTLDLLVYSYYTVYNQTFGTQGTALVSLYGSTVTPGFNSFGDAGSFGVTWNTDVKAGSSFSLDGISWQMQ